MGKNTNISNISTKLKTYNHQTPKYSKGIWQLKENYCNKIFEKKRM